MGRQMVDQRQLFYLFNLETTFQRVSQEVGTQSIEFTEELTLATAEPSYLSDRRQTFKNLAKRVPL